MGFKARTPPVDEGFSYKGQPVPTMRHLLQLMIDCTALGEPLELKQAYIEYAGEEIALQNMGYLIGYLDEKRRNHLYEQFQIRHPLLSMGPTNGARPR